MILDYIPYKMPSQTGRSGSIRVGEQSNEIRPIIGSTVINANAEYYTTL